jgi:integrase
MATRDKAVADVLFGEIVRELEDRKHKKDLGIAPTNGTVATLKAYAEYHLRKKDEDGKVTDSWWEQSRKHLLEAVEFFGASKPLASIETDDLTEWVEVLRNTDNGRGGTLSESSVLKRLNTLSNLFKRAVSEKKSTGVESNPVGEMFEKPSAASGEAPYLEPEEAALLLEAARTYKPETENRAQAHGGAIVADAYPYMYPLLATYLLTGCRKSEVLGLEVDDLNLKHRKVYLQPNKWRRLKTRKSKRTIPLWPQLEEILREYLLERERTGGLGRLLFPAHRGDGEKMITDLRKALDKIGRRAGFPKGFVKLHMLRHTYTAARIQTCDRGRPVALYTVARELGHSGTDMLEDRYGHLHDATEEGDPEVVEFRVEHHMAKIGDRLEAM